MSRIEEAKEILRALGLPAAQQNEISALTLLALGRIPPDGKWADVRGESLTITKGIMEFIAREYGRAYAPNTRETFRRRGLHQFVQAHIAVYNPDTPDLPTNSPRAHYALTEAARTVLRAYGTSAWSALVADFLKEQGSLRAAYQKRRSAHHIPVRLPNGTEALLSPGSHNRLQAAIVETFAPQFVTDAVLLYLGDTASKFLIFDATALAQLGVRLTEHGKLPDVVLWDTFRNRLFLVEAVTSHGPMTPKRVVELHSLFAGCAMEQIYVSAFPNFAAFRQHLRDIAWETEVWIAEVPDHLIHFDGERFLGSNRTTTLNEEP